MRKQLGFQKCDGRTDIPTDTARCRVACPRLKIVSKGNTESKKGEKKARRRAGAVIEKATQAFGQE